MTAPLSTGSVPLADYMEALRWLKAALDLMDEMAPTSGLPDYEDATQESREFLKMYPGAAVQLDLLASIEHARGVREALNEVRQNVDDAVAKSKAAMKSIGLEEVDDARR